MKNTFNVEVSFDESPKKPYEWKNVSFITGIKVNRVDSKCIKDFLLYKCKVDSENRLLLLSDTKDSILIKLDEEGIITKRSFLLFSKDLDVSEYAINLKPIKLKYEVFCERIKYSNELDEEKEIRDYLVKSIENIEDEDKSKYLYFLYFDDVNGYSKEKLINTIKKDNTKKNYELYKFLINN